MFVFKIIFLVLLCIFSNCLYRITKSASSTTVSLSTKAVVGFLSSVSVGSSKVVAYINDPYMRDVEVLTQLNLESRVSKKEFISNIMKLSKQNGIINWKNDPKTLFAMGRSFKKMGLPKENFINYLEFDSKSFENVNNYINLGYSSL